MAETLGDQWTARRRRQWFLGKMKRAQGGAGGDLRALMALTRRSFMFDPSVVGVRYAIVGGVATSAYMPERTTRDIDILVLPAELDAARANLAARGWSQKGRLKPEPGLGLDGESWHQGDDQLDVLWADQAWVREAVSEAAQSDRPVIALPFLVMMKMNAARGVDQGDLTRMLGFADDAALERTKHVVRLYRPDLLEDLEQYIEIGRLEVGEDR